MSVYAIGDIQGCYDELQALLEKIAFTPEKDQLWFTGDLVNRGPKSLEVLRFVKGLGDSAITVLGNHDLHLLALAHGNQRFADNKESSLDAIFQAADRDELLHWLRHQPLLHHDQQLGFTMVHAGLPPQWDLTIAIQMAKKVEAALQGEEYLQFFSNMYGSQPDQWHESLQGMDRLRFAVNCFTRLRYCDKDGKLLFKPKGKPGTQPAGSYPWFEIEQRKSQTMKIIIGHWSTLGLHIKNNIFAIDTGCLWGGCLTALRIDSREPQTIGLDCVGNKKPGEKE